MAAVAGDSWRPRRSMMMLAAVELFEASSAAAGALGAVPAPTKGRMLFSPFFVAGLVKIVIFPFGGAQPISGGRGRNIRA
uniref:Putative secreted peptide n=1 Tax=Anopheles braziliensis TaxID=58242 RepID=A0A2M3ZMD0_9DIPT